MGMTSTQERLPANFENPFKNPYENDILPAPTTLERGWSGASTAHSQHAEKDEWGVEDVYGEKAECTEKQKRASVEQALPFQNVPAPDAVRVLSFHHPGRCRKHLTVKDEGGKTVYFADVSRWTKAPDIVLHTGETRDHPVAAIARFRYSRHLLLSLGDPAEATAIVWEEMRNMKRLGHSLYRIEITNSEPGGSGKSPALVFQRTRVKEDGVTNKWSWMNFKLIEEATGEVLAVYLATGLRSFKKRGTLHIKSRFVEGNVEVVAILGLCGLIEKKWRRDQRNSGG